MKAMIFAAGLGTRLYPITQSIPKALVPVGGKPLIEHTILKLKNAGCSEIIINVHHFADQIVDFLHRNNHFGLPITISDERDLLLDTGGGIKKTAPLWHDDEPILIHNVDILSNVDLADIYHQHRQNPDRLATLVISRRDTYRYLLFDHRNLLHGWINIRTGQTKPQPDMSTSQLNRYAYAGIQVVSPRIFRLMQDQPAVFPIMDFYLERCHSEKIVGYAPANLRMLDVGKVGALEQAEAFFHQ